MIKAIFFALLFASAAYAAKTLAVLEIIPATDDLELSISEMRHLSDELRRQAVSVLPLKDYAVLTRDNMISLLPSDEAELECLAESCAVDIGRAIGAEYVSHGKIGRFAGDWSLSIELYETMGGKLLGSIVMESPDIKGLMVAIRELAPGLFAKMKPVEEVKPETKELKVEEPTAPLPQPPIPEPQPKKSYTWLAVSLDVLGAVVLGYGIYQHSEKNRLYDKYKKMPEHMSQKAYDAALEKANDARVSRDVGFIVGGVLLGSGIMVHIWF